MLPPEARCAVPYEKVCVPCGSVEASRNHWSAWSETEGRVGLVAKLILQVESGGTEVSPDSRMVAVISVAGVVTSQPYCTERMSTGLSVGVTTSSAAV